MKECQPRRVIAEKSYLLSKAKTLSFAPRSIGVEITDKRIEDVVRQDPIPYVPIINPRSILPLIDSNWRKDEVGLPTVPKDEIQAARLIVIRRKKMKKHQRRKLWKRMRHRWARVWITRCYQILWTVYLFLNKNVLFYSTSKSGYSETI